MSLVTSKKMFAAAMQGGYAIGAFNINNLETLQGIMDAAQEEMAPVIIQASPSAVKYAGIRYLSQLVATAAEEHPHIPICLHLDHGSSFELCYQCIENGFTSVMIDASAQPFEQNVALTRQVVQHAHNYGVVVEAELGRLAGVEDEVQSERSIYTEPAQAAEFVAQTGVDSLAIAIGTSHGAYKFSGTPHLRMDILQEVARLLPNLPIVLHGASAVPAELIAQVNQYGGQMPNAQGVPDALLREAAKSAVCKVNVDSDLRLAMTGSIRQYFAQHPTEFDPRKYLGEARTAIKNLVSYKMREVLGCSHHSQDGF